MTGTARRKTTPEPNQVMLDVGRLEGQLTAVNESLEKIDRWLLGNGQEGIKDRLTRLEENLEVAVGLAKKSEESMDALSKSISSLREPLDTHIKDKDKHSVRILLDKRVIGCVIGFIIIMDVLVEHAPEWVSVLAKWIFGL